MISPFRTTEERNRWSDLASDNPNVRFTGLYFWVNCLQRLPAPALFPMLKERHRLKGWASIMEASADFCRCGQERLLLPVRPLTFYESEQMEPITISAAHPLLLGVWGADMYQTQIQVWVQGGVIVTCSMPYAFDRRPELLDGQELLANPDLYMERHGKPGVNPVGRESLDKVAASIQANGPIDRVVTLRVEGTKPIEWPMYRIMDVDSSTDSMRVMVNRTACIIDPDMYSIPHVCQP